MGVISFGGHLSLMVTGGFPQESSVREDGAACRMPILGPIEAVPDEGAAQGGGIDMPMDDARLFAVLAQCFGPVAQDEWERTIGDDEWQALIARLRALVQWPDAWGVAAPVKRARRAVPLQEFLSEREVDALFSPPSFSLKQKFAARHFTGGLPDSALPIESLHVEWTADPKRGLFARQKGLYSADTALYMRDLIDGLGLELPESLAAYPDHLSLELDTVSYLLEAGRISDARQLFLERSEWLTAYRLKLVALGEEALFYLAIVDALLGIRAQLLAEEGRGVESA